MNRSVVIAVLRAHEAQLRAEGVSGLSLFGSVAREEPRAADVDIAVRLDRAFSRPGFDYIARLDDLERTLSSLLGVPVDVIEEPAGGRRLQTEIDRDRVVAF